MSYTQPECWTSPCGDCLHDIIILAFYVQSLTKYKVDKCYCLTFEKLLYLIFQDLSKVEFQNNIAWIIHCGANLSSGSSSKQRGCHRWLKLGLDNSYPLDLTFLVYYKEILIKLLLFDKVNIYHTFPGRKIKQWIYPSCCHQWNGHNSVLYSKKKQCRGIWLSKGNKVSLFCHVDTCRYSVSSTSAYKLQTYNVKVNFFSVLLCFVLVSARSISFISELADVTSAGQSHRSSVLIKAPRIHSYSERISFVLGKTFTSCYRRASIHPPTSNHQWVSTLYLTIFHHTEVQCSYRKMSGPHNECLNRNRSSVV